jgi:hypothetical protein
VADEADVVGAADDALGKQKPSGELPIRARRAHDDHERRAVQPDLQWLLDGSQVACGARAPARHPFDLDRPERAGHRAWPRHRSR